MAYRKTEKVQAALDAKRNAIIKASIAIIGAEGMEAFNASDVAARAGVSHGTVYQHFADVNELRAAVVAHVAARHLALIRQAAEAQRTAVAALAFATLEYFEGLGPSNSSNRLLARAMANEPSYRLAIRDELAKLIRAAVECSLKVAQLQASAAVGAILTTHAMTGGSKQGASTAVLFVLRGIGVPNRAAVALAY